MQYILDDVSSVRIAANEARTLSRARQIDWPDAPKTTHEIMLQKIMFSIYTAIRNATNTHKTSIYFMIPMIIEIGMIEVDIIRPMLVDKLTNDGYHVNVVDDYNLYIHWSEAYVPRVSVSGSDVPDSKSSTKPKKTSSKTKKTNSDTSTSKLVRID
jgi:hypothetical protein